MVTDMGKGFEKETKRFGVSVLFRDSAVDAGGCADEPWQFQCTCAMDFPPEDLSR